jgi:hypothetical protein
MRNAILFLLFCAAAIWLYVRYLTTPGAAIDTGGGSALDQPASPAAPGVFTMPDPVAWKETDTSDSWTGPVVAVVLVDGNRWRVEARVPSWTGAVVCVFDGVNFASSPPNITEAIKIDQASAMRGLFTDINRLRPAAIEQRDGYSCWLFNDDSKQGNAQVWMDRETLFPVVVQGTSVAGIHTEVHYQLLKSDFSVLRGTAFDIHFLSPQLMPFLNP